VTEKEKDSKTKTMKKNSKTLIFSLILEVQKEKIVISDLQRISDLYRSYESSAVKMIVPLKQGLKHGSVPPKNLLGYS